MPYAITCTWNLKKKMIQMSLFTHKKQIHRLREQTFYQRRVEGRDRLGVWESVFCV